MALTHATTRELVWGLRAVTREMNAWRRHALRIPSAQLRADALDALNRKRTHADGAALFWILPRRRSAVLLRALVTYELILDFLDNVNESAQSAGERNGRQLHLALIEAVDPAAPLSDYYRHHPWRDDAGYLRALVQRCRQACRSLPSYERVRDLVVREAVRGQVLAINHHPSPALRDASLRAWVREAVEPDLAARHEAEWFELTAASSASLTLHALLAHAADPACRREDAIASYRAYFPWISATTTMLDSYVDRPEDLARDAHSYTAHYPSSEIADLRLADLIRRSAIEARGLRDGHRHAVIVACMVAMYLSRDSARTSAMRAGTRELILAGGSLSRLLTPVLRAWRIVYDHRAA